MAQKFYLTNETAVFQPTNFRGTWDNVSQAVTRLIDQTKYTGGNVTTVTVADDVVPNPWRVCLYRGVSGPLAATASTPDTLDVVIGVGESNADADFHWHVHAYITAGDTDTVRGTILSDYEEAAGVNEWPTSAAGKALNAAQATSGVTVSQGDRLVVEIGYTARNAHNTSRDGVLYYGTQVSGDIVADLAAAGAPALGAGFVTLGSGFGESGTIKSRVANFGVEVSRDGPQKARVSQFGVEPIRDGPRKARVPQCGVEVFRTNDPGATPYWTRVRYEYETIDP